MNDLASFTSLYIETAKENVRIAKESLGILAQNKTDEKAIEEIYRNTHTLKSKSYMMSQKQVGDLAKSIEDIFYQVKNKTAVLTDEMLKQAQNTIQILEQQLNFSPSIKILIVEDDAFFQKFYTTKLTEKGFEIFLAIDGEDALQKITEVKPDLVLLDIIMPKIDGFEVLTVIKENPETRNIPIIVFSSLGQEDDIKKAKALGAVDYMYKSFYDFDLLLSKINTYGRKQ